MNRLANETSPYLRQHRDNPVDWYPWGDEAFERARQTDRPVFVSIGYAACHWCHVMAHESFENEAVAALLNDRFVSIKIDREERPDLDAIYLEAVQALTGGGGWPLSVFLDHDRRPFYGGTYFPPRDGHGLPSFTTLLNAIADAWSERRSDLLAQGEEITKVVSDRLEPTRVATTSLSRGEIEGLFEQAIEAYASRFDHDNGGLGGAPKFPQPPMLELLCEGAQRGLTNAAEMLEQTLLSMASGGIYDQLGGGFARYSVDRSWLVPHFEKMLYDQAGLARVYLHAYQLTGDLRYRQIVEETLDYVLRDLLVAKGAIASSEDADSEGEEGLFYLWGRAELDALLGVSAGVVAAFYGVSEAGNFEGANILHIPKRGALVRPKEIDAARAVLFTARATRVRPGLDDKVITEWNAMIAGVLAEAGSALSMPRYLKAATEIAEFLRANLRDESGRYLRSWQDGRARHLAIASDYAWLVDCFTRLYEATGEDEWLGHAEEAAEDLIEKFSALDGAWYLTGEDGEALIVRPQDSNDGVVPATGSIATSALARLGALTSKDRYLERAEAGLKARARLLVSAPLALPHLLQSAAVLSGDSLEVLISGERPDLVALVQSSYLPRAVLAWGAPTDRPLWEGRERPGAYVCHGGVCDLPVDSELALTDALGLSGPA